MGREIYTGQMICLECTYLQADMGAHVGCEECGGRLKAATVADLKDEGWSEEDITDAVLEARPND